MQPLAPEPPKDKEEPLYTARRRSETQGHVKMVWAICVILLLGVLLIMYTLGPAPSLGNAWIYAIPVVLCLTPPVVVMLRSRPDREELVLYPSKLLLRKQETEREEKWADFQYVRFGHQKVDGKDEPFVHIQFKRLSVKPSRDLCSPELLAQVEQLTVRPMIKESLREYRNGRDLEFGPIRVSERGVRGKRGTLGWHKIEGFELGSEPTPMSSKPLPRPMLQIKAKGRAEPFISEDVRELPNMRLLIAVLEHALGEVTNLSMAWERYVHDGEFG